MFNFLKLSGFWSRWLYSVAKVQNEPYPSCGRSCPLASRACSRSQAAARCYQPFCRSNQRSKASPNAWWIRRCRDRTAWTPLQQALQKRNEISFVLVGRRGRRVGIVSRIWAPMAMHSFLILLFAYKVKTLNRLVDRNCFENQTTAGGHKYDRKNSSSEALPSWFWDDVMFP